MSKADKRKPEATILGLPVSDVAVRVGSLSQVARIDQFIEADGPQRGTRLIRLVTGGGLELEIHPDRAFDLGQATFNGVPVAWVSPVGPTNPAFYDAGGLEWLRTFSGGLMCTCGLDTFGPPSVDDGVAYPMHGRIGTTPGTLLRAAIDEELLVVEGEVRQVRVFATNLLLHRRIEAPLGGTSVRILDTVTNQGPADAGHMVLYHCNIGWPLLDESAHLSIPSAQVTPRDDDATAGVARWHLVDPPEAGFREQLFIHELQGSGRASVGVDNAELGVRLDLSFDNATLPGFHQWKMADHGHFVMGLEPNNCNWTGGRASARAAGLLPVLRPGESACYDLEFSFTQTSAATGRKDADNERE